MQTLPPGYPLLKNHHPLQTLYPIRARKMSDSSDSSDDVPIRNNFKTLVVSARKSNENERVAIITDNDGKVGEWTVDTGKGLTVAAADAILRRMATTTDPLDDMVQEINKVREMAIRYRGVHDLQSTDRARVRCRLSTMNLRLKLNALTNRYIS